MGRAVNLSMGRAVTVHCTSLQGLLEANELFEEEPVSMSERKVCGMVADRRKVAIAIHTEWMDVEHHPHSAWHAGRGMPRRQFTYTVR